MAIVVPAGNAWDLAGNVAPMATSEQVTVNNQDPILLSISNPSRTHINTGTVEFKLQYMGAKDVDLTSGAVTLNTTGTATGTIEVIRGQTRTPKIKINGISGEGTLSITVAAGTGTNGGDANLEVTSAEIVVENSAPNLQISAPSLSDTSRGPVSFTLEYLGARRVQLTEGDISLNKTGSVSFLTF